MRLFFTHRQAPGTVRGTLTGHSFVRAWRIAPWELLNVASLDAPLIAVLWQLLLGRTLGATLSWQHSALLGAAVWLIYSADRWLDGLELGTARARTQRHRFYVRHRRAVLRVWVGAGAGTLAGSFAVLTPPELLAAGILGGLMLGYFTSRHTASPKAQPKELQIGFIFALGVLFMPSLNGAPVFPLFAFAPLFAALVFLNCALIALWEGELDLEPVPFAARAPRVAARLPAATLGLAVCAFGVGLTAYPPLFFSLGGSALLLYGCGHLTSYLSPAARRVAADAALLTPLLALLFSRG